MKKIFMILSSMLLVASVNATDVGGVNNNPAVGTGTNSGMDNNTNNSGSGINTYPGTKPVVPGTSNTPNNTGTGNNGMDTSGTH